MVQGQSKGAGVEVGILGAGLSVNVHYVIYFPG